MRKATENQGNTRALVDYYSPRSKVKDIACQQRSPPQYTSSYQETPMKPSQVHNRLSYPAPRRVLPLQSPEVYYRDRPAPHRHSPHSPRSIHSSGFVPRNQNNIGSSVNRPHPIPKDRLGPSKHSTQPQGLVPSSSTNVGTSAHRLQPSARIKLGPLQYSTQSGPGPFSSSQPFPVSPANTDTSASRPQPSPASVFHPASPQSVKSPSNHSPSSHKRDHMTESKVVLLNSGSKDITPQRQDSNKSSDVKSSIHSVELHCPPASFMTPSVSTRAAQELHKGLSGISQWVSRGYQPPPNAQCSERRSDDNLPIMHSPYQRQQHEQTPLSEKLNPVVDLNCSSQKRHREFDYGHKNVKKPCLQGANSGKIQTTKPTVGSSPGSSPVSQPSVLSQSSKTTDSHLSTEPACEQSTSSELSSTFKPAHSGCMSSSPKHYTRTPPSQGVKQAYLNTTHNHIVKLQELRSASKQSEESLKKRREENRSAKSSTLLSSEVPQKDSSSSSQAELSSHHSGHTACRTSFAPEKTPRRGNPAGESRKPDSSSTTPTSKPNSGSPSGRNKLTRARRTVVMPNDADELFTPDPMIYVVNSAYKTARPKIDGETVKSPTSEKYCSSSSSSPVSGSSCHKTQNSTATGSPHAAASSARNHQITLPTVTLTRVDLENTVSLCPKDKEVKNSAITSSGRELKNESVKSDGKRTSLLSSDAISFASETDNAASKQTSASSCSQPLPLKRLTTEGGRKQVNEEDPIDLELDLGLNFALDLDLDGTQSSDSSEDEKLISLQEMMERVTKPPDTPEKGAYSEPSTPGQRSSLAKTPLISTTKPGVYKNNLDQMLKEINTNKRAKEIEAQLLSECKEDLLRIAEYEEAEEDQGEDVSTEEQEFLQRYSLMSSAIKDVPPGEVVFNLEKFGQIFDQDTLQLKRCMVNPHGTAQKTLLWSSPAQLRLHVNIGLFQEAYDSGSPCPAYVTCFLFKMMSVYRERMVSEKMLQALCDIACTAAYQIVENGSQKFKVWVPSLADVTLVLMNMGVAFVTLFPFENLQPPFTEGDLLEDVHIKSESPSNKERISFPEHNCNNILQYLSTCMCLCPRAYSDDELLLLLTVVGRVALDTRLIQEFSVKLYPLQYKIVDNIRDWDAMLPRICLALTDLTDDHHNMCLIVHLLPDNTRGKQLRRHLSMSMISKLLDGNCTYRPSQNEFQLSVLRPYVPRMQPSTLLKGMLSSSSRSQKDKGEDITTLDQQAYYLCYSLLTLTNEASNFPFFPASQKEQLLVLSYELETHVKCDIRESEKCLYRSKVKDLVARIYNKWQMLLQRTRPLHGKLYDYWQPVGTLMSSQEELEDGEGTVIEQEHVMEEEETTLTEENDVVMVAEEEEEEWVEAEEDMKLDEKLGEMEEDGTMTDTSKREEVIEPLPDDLSQVMPEMEPHQAVNEETEVGNRTC